MRLLKTFTFFGRDSKSLFSEASLSIGTALNSVWTLEWLKIGFLKISKDWLQKKVDSNWICQNFASGYFTVVMTSCKYLSTIFDVTWPLSGGNWNLCTTFIIFCIVNQFRKRGQVLGLLWRGPKFSGINPKTSQELRMLSLSLFIQGSLWMMILLFSIVRHVINVSQATNL